MERRHNDELSLRLERVADIGHAIVTKAELKRWYGIHRVALRTRQDMAGRWQEIVDDESRDLVCIDRSDIFLLLDGGSVRPLLREGDD
jgi:hypothetical protein